MNTFKPGVIMIQESKLINKGTIKIEGFDTFEFNRKTNGGGGGLLTAIDQNYNPVLISEHDDTEILVVEATIGENKIVLHVNFMKNTGNILGN